MPIDQVVAELARGEGPQPVGDSVDAPAGLISMQHGAGSDLVQNPLVLPSQEQREVPPALCQAPGTDGKSERGSSDFHAVADADSDRIMQPGGVDQKTQPRSRVCQGLRDRRGHDLLTRTAPVAVDRVFGDLRGDRRDVFDEPSMRADRVAEFALTVRAFAQRVFLVIIDLIGRGAARARMAALAAGGFLAPPSSRFGIHRAHARGGRGTDGGVFALGTQPLPLFGLVRQFEDGADRLCARQFEEGPGLLACHVSLGSSVRTSRQYCVRGYR